MNISLKHPLLAIPFALPIALSTLLSACNSGLTSGPNSGSVAADQKSAGLIGGQSYSPGDGMTMSIPILILNFQPGKTGTYSECSGTLIAPDLVLTAAHCVEAIPNDPSIKNTVSFSGAAKIDANYALVIDPKTQFEFTAKDVAFNHVNSDIGLIHLPHKLGSQYVPITPLKDASKLQVDTQTMILGYGGNQQLNSIVGKVRSLNEHGPLLLAQAGLAIPYDLISVAAVDQTGTTHGDSGGPALFFENGKPYVWGADSVGYFSNGQGTEGFDTGHGETAPEGFYRVSAYAPIMGQIAWLNEAAKKLGSSSKF